MFAVGKLVEKGAQTKAQEAEDKQKHGQIIEKKLKNWESEDRKYVT
jgi:hypothetical protein